MVTTCYEHTRSRKCVLCQDADQVEEECKEAEEEEEEDEGTLQLEFTAPIIHNYTLQAVKKNIYVYIMYSPTVWRCSGRPP